MHHRELYFLIYLFLIGRYCYNIVLTNTHAKILHRETYVPTPSHLCRLSQSTGFELSASYSTPLAMHSTYGGYLSPATHSLHLPQSLSFPHCVQKPVPLCLCLHCPESRLVSTRSSRFTYMHYYAILFCFFFFWLYSYNGLSVHPDPLEQTPNALSSVTE